MCLFSTFNIFINNPQQNMMSDRVMVGGGQSGNELCKERLIGKVGGPFLDMRQCRTAAGAQTRDAGTQEIERHMGNSSTGPALRTKRENINSNIKYLDSDNQHQ